MEIRKRILLRYLPVAVALAAMGYVFAQAFLILQKTYGGVADPANNQVLWRTPLTMVAFGLILMVGIELLQAFIRRKPPTETPKSLESSLPKPGPTE